jgi:uncharacterized 2Fe-2S/4Fe-4S cluster protein (DUF4445 family)
MLTVVMVDGSFNGSFNGPIMAHHWPWAGAVHHITVTSRDEIERVVCRIEKIETAVEPLFQHHFVEAMAIPHKTARFANLEKALKLPLGKEIVVPGDDGGERRRRRRG